MRVIDNSGNVGIGTRTPGATLEVSGSINITGASALFELTPHDAPPTCGAALEGAIYYDDSLAELCDCDGTGWSQVDGGGAC